MRPRDRSEKGDRRTGIRRWQLAVNLGIGDDGKRRQVYRSFNGTKAQAHAELRDLVAEVERGEVARSAAPTYAEWAERWLRDKAVRGIRTRTVESYTLLLSQHVVPSLGGLRLDRITPEAVQKLVDDLARCGRKSTGRVGEALSGTTVRRVHQALRASLKAAMRMRLLGRNPATDIELPKSEPKPARALDMEQAIALVDQAAGTRLELPVLVAACTGLRRGEILGLQWRDFDEEGRTLHVDRQVGRGRVLGPPKSASGVRDVPIPQPLVDAFVAHRARVLGGDVPAPAQAAHDERFIFAEPDARPWDPESISTVWRGIVRRANIGHVRLHDLRHSAGSILLAEGVPIPVVAEILGHGSPVTTMRVYAHALRGGADGARDKMSNALHRARRSRSD